MNEELLQAAEWNIQRNAYILLCIELKRYMNEELLQAAEWDIQRNGYILVFIVSNMSLFC
jgi:hypothetical protein